MGCTGWRLLWLACLVFTFLQYGAWVMKSLAGDTMTLWTRSNGIELNWIGTKTLILQNIFALEFALQFVGMLWSADIIVNYTRASDAGVYRCVVKLSLTVLAPPSLPVCLWEGDTDAGGSFPAPQVIWKKLEPDRMTLPVNMDGDLKGSVHIANVSAQASGLYCCSETNLLGTQHCYCTLTSPDNSPGILQGVLLSLSMALLLLALMVLVQWLHRSVQESKWRNSHEENEGYNEVKYTPSLIKRSFI
uniref:Zgc:165604 n=1 Tax=Cyprinus carpio TaxID=7962 RepID=A0A8C1V447_CYPCA